MHPSSEIAPAPGPALCVQRLVIVGMALLLSGCAGVQTTGLNSDARDTFLRRFHEVSYAVPTERAQAILGPALQFPGAYSKERISGTRTPKDTINSLCWMRSVPDDITGTGQLLITGLAVVDPDYVKTYAAKVPEDFKCKNDESAQIAFAKSYLAARPGATPVTPNSQFKAYRTGLLTAKGGKPIGSSMVKVTLRVSENHDRIAKLIDTSNHTLVFDRIPDDPEGRIILIGWATGGTATW